MAPNEQLTQSNVITQPPMDVIGAEAERIALASDPTAAHDDHVIDVTGGSLSEYAGAWVKRVRGGDSGALPVMAGLIVLVIVFQLEKSVFLHSENLVNLLAQGAVFVMVGMAEIFVLLLGEIDLSAGFVAGVGACFAVWLSSVENLPWTVSVIGAIAGTAAIGFIQGNLITRLRLPSFVVTLSGYLFWTGFIIWFINEVAPGSGGTIRLTNTFLRNIVNGSMSPTAGWIGIAVIVGVFAALAFVRDTRRRASGLVAPPLALTLLKIAAMAGAGVILVAICNTNRGLAVGSGLRGVPYFVPVVLFFVVAYSFLLTRTRYGRHVYAIGGNAEAARRAGINLRRARIIAFMLCSGTAGVGGIIYASRLASISNNIDGGTLVLYSIASAVIGGTSLFGGRGKMLHALLGGLVIATIYNGILLIGLGAAAQYMITALVLLAAVTIDAVARRGAA
jgi:D-xylose transport system permease protein